MGNVGDINLYELANQYDELVKKQKSEAGIYLKLSKGKVEVQRAGLFTRMCSKKLYKFQPIADAIMNIYEKAHKEASLPTSQLDEETFKNIEKFTSWFENRVVNYNTPSLVSSLFRRIFSQKREISGPTTFAKLADIRNKFFTNQTKELLELLPQLKGGNSEALAQSLAFPVGTKRGFANLQKAEVAIQEFINNSWIVNNNLIGSLRFNCEEEKLSLPDLQKQESLSKKLSNLLWEKEPPSLKELTIAAKGVIQMSENLSKLQETYKKEFKKNKIPQWEKVFDELYQKLRTLSKNQGNPTKEECETQIQNFKTEFQAVQAQIMAQDLPQSKGYEILREDIDHLIAAKSPGGWLHNQPPE